MALRKISHKAKVENETGLSTNANLSGGRFLNSDGRPNIEMRGMGFFARLNIYHSLLSMRWWKFFVVIVVFFTSVNLLFAGIYLSIGLENLNGMVAHNNAERFGEAFFFSAQTFTTVGYGRVNPVGFWASGTASFEALIGLMSFAVVTGLLYGRFAKPRAYLRYSKNALVAPFKDGTSLMFRMVPFTKNVLSNVEVKATLAIRVHEDGQFKNRFFNLPLDISKATLLSSNWTLVHVINEDSPLYNLSKEDIINSQAEILVYVQGFDESFSNTVLSRTSYSYDQLVYGAKFVQMYHPNEERTSTVLYLDKLSDYEPAELPVKY